MKNRSLASAPADDPIFRRPEAASYVGLSLPAYDRLVRSGQIRTLKLASRVRATRRSFLNEFLDRLADEQSAS